MFLSKAGSPEAKPIASAQDLLFTFTGPGTSSRRPVKIDVFTGKPGSGINFLGATTGADGKESKKVSIPARADYVVGTLRNVVLGMDGARVCFVEHILAAVALWGAPDLVIEVNGPEIPLGDGSATFWIKLFESSGYKRQVPRPAFALKEPLVVAKSGKQVIALPADSFSITYLMDWQHPAIGKRWCTWAAKDPIEQIADARTFGSQSEQEMLGLSDNFVNLTADGFSKPLRYEDEPVRHKLLDLLGDLVLCGVNPLAIKAQFISIKGGHELDVQLARGLVKTGFTKAKD